MTRNPAQVHLINPLRNRWGGSERRTIETARLVAAQAPATVWCAPNASPALVRESGARVLNPWLLQFPRGGTLVFVGTYFSVGRWIRFAEPARVVVIFNTDQPRWLRDNLARIATSGCTAEVVYTSHALRKRHNGVGPVLESPIDVARFPFAAPVVPAARPFTVGRYSRDHRSKHHADDPALWRELAAQGVRVRLMGATCLADELTGVPGIELLPAGAEPPLDFLRSLDAFVYRTADTWFEAFGRVVFEAMAAGVPLICGRRGGFADYLTQGHSALLCDSAREFVACATALRDDPALAGSLARNARHVVERVNGDALRRATRVMLAGRAPDADGAGQATESGFGIAPATGAGEH
ncbi:MAG: glycosyltransferase family 4 protein [Proteobacteria bacterium]|nr:glycosyltransferase family 4 protein [Pseudomonadota bacterium]